MSRPSDIKPVAVPLPHVAEMFGISRSTTYRLAKAGKIRLMKQGRNTLADCDSMRRYLDSLPPVTFGTKTAA